MCASCFFDPKKRVFGVAHAGWRGSLEENGKETALLMKSEFGSKLSELKVFIGPFISQGHFQVGSEVYELFQKKFPKDFQSFCVIKNKKGYIDLGEVNQLSLERIGVLKKNIIIDGSCTIRDNNNFFSYRKEKKTGRFGLFAALRPKSGS